MSQETHYFKIGAFVIAMIAFMIGAIIVTSSGLFSEHYQIAETYFDESVQGLEIGSQVKFRGMPIGQVTKISMVSHIYGNRGNQFLNPNERYVYVQFDMSPDLFSNGDRTKIKKLINQSVQKGLRARLATQDLVGTVFLELNFFDPKTNPPVDINWTPKYMYIPSAKSPLSRFASNIQKLTKQLDEIDFARLFKQIDTLVTTATSVLNATQMQALTTEMMKTLKSLDKAAISLDDILSSEKTQKLYDNLYRSSISLNASLKSLNQSVTQFNAVSSSQQQNLASTLGDLSDLTLNLKQFTDGIKSNPSQVVWGKSPPKLDPSKL
ncbi:MAG: MlaD family protein [Gammaproteobacteria bacterium]